MSNQNKTSTLTIIGLVLAVLAIICGFIPCIGLVAFIPGIIALIIGGIALAQARDSGTPKTLPMVILVVSMIACIASAYQAYTVYSLSKKATSEVKKYTNCDDLEKDFNALVQRLEEIDESDDMAHIGEVMTSGFKLAQMGKQAEELGCDLETDIKIEEDGSEEAEEEDAIEQDSLK